MPVVRPQQIEMIPVSKITVLNPRSRNKRQHREIVNNIESIGLKRPITVSRHQGPGGPRYDLVCGEGRLEAFQMLGQTEIPAVVIEASESDCLVMSLVESTITVYIPAAGGILAAVVIAAFGEVRTEALEFASASAAMFLLGTAIVPVVATFICTSVGRSSAGKL